MGWKEGADYSFNKKAAKGVRAAFEQGFDMDWVEIVVPGANGEDDSPEILRKPVFEEKKGLEWSKLAGQRCTFTGPLYCPDNGVHLRSSPSTLGFSI